MTTFYTYIWLREDGTPYYIGKGSGYRISEKKHSVVVPSKPYRRFVSKNLSEHDAYALEGWLTHRYGLIIDNTGILENKVHGGDNVSLAGFTGRHHSNYSKEKISHGNTGKVRTEEHKANYRKPKTAEHAENIRQAVLNNNDPDRYIYNKPFAHKGKPWTQARRNAQKLKIKANNELA